MSISLTGDAVGIIGSGNSAHALACYLAANGHRVHMYIRNPRSAEKLRARKTIQSSGYLEGTFAIHQVHSEFSTFCDAVRTIFVATTSESYIDVAERVAPYVTCEHAVVLFSGKLLGSVAFQKTLFEKKAARCIVLETDALFACRLQDDGSVVIKNKKKWNLVAAPTRGEAEAGAHRLFRFFDGLELAENIVQRGLTDFGAMAHPIIMLANLNKIDRGEEFLFYVDGLTPRTSVLLSAMHLEMKAVASAYGSDLIEIPNLLNAYYGADLSSPYDAMRSVSNYKTSVAPKSLDHRYLKEDISCTIVPARELAKKAQVHTPILDSVVSLASCLLETDFASVGRNLASLGWGHLTAEQIYSQVSATFSRVPNSGLSIEKRNAG